MSWTETTTQRGTSGIVLFLRFLPGLVHFSLLPESIELGDAHGREVKVALLGVRLDAAEALGELAGGSAQGILGVDTQVAADGGEGVQQVAHLITSLGIRGGGAQLVQLLAYLGQGALHVRPVEAQLRRLVPDRLGQRERRQRRWDTVERRGGRSPLGPSLLRALDALPVTQDFGGAADPHVAKDVRMAAHQLPVDGFRYV